MACGAVLEVRVPCGFERRGVDSAMNSQQETEKFIFLKYNPKLAEEWKRLGWLRIIKRAG